LRPPAAPRSRQAALDEEQLALLLRALEGSDLHPPALLAALTGLRRGELLALRWQDVDLAACTLAVRRSLEQTRAGLRFKPPKSRSGLRSLALPGLACEELRRLAAGAGRSGDGPRAAGAEDLVFARPDGRPLEPDAFSATFHDAMLRLGFPGVHLHTLRHSHASQLLRAGASPVEVARRLGHASPVVTLTTYAHLLPGEDAEAARLVEERLRAAMSRLGGSAR
ncbi:MAG: site-specific integrase, partial [Clostridia bacterium]|nr:site-specific integrase [Clostridia bacterium]